MPLEPNLATVVVLLVGVVMATIAGGLIGRRVRTWREHRAARKALSNLAASNATAAALARATQPVVPVDTGVAPSSAATVVGTSYLARRLAGAPPPVVSRRPSSLSPAVEANGGRGFASASSLTMPTPSRPGRRQRRLGVAVGVVAVLFATGIAFGVAGTRSVPHGEVLDAEGTPGPGTVAPSVVAVAGGLPSESRARSRHRGARHRRGDRRAPHPSPAPTTTRP